MGHITSLVATSGSLCTKAFLFRRMFDVSIILAYAELDATIER